MLSKSEKNKCPYITDIPRKDGENMKVQLMNKISQVGLQVFDEMYTYGEDIKNPDALWYAVPSCMIWYLNRD